MLEADEEQLFADIKELKDKLVGLADKIYRLENPKEPERSSVECKIDKITRGTPSVCDEIEVELKPSVDELDYKQMWEEVKFVYRRGNEVIQYMTALEQSRKTPPEPKKVGTIRIDKKVAEEWVRTGNNMIELTNELEKALKGS